MSRNLQTRVARLVERMGDPNSIETRLRAMSDEELSAALRQLMLKDGYDPSLPHEEALAAYIAKLETELPTLGEQEQGWQRQIIEHLKQKQNDLPLMFPESPRQPQEAHHG